MAHHITDADKNLIKVAGNYGGIKTKTLWTNPSPTSEFGPETITLTDENLNTYSTIQIVYYNANYGNRYITTEIKPDGNTYEMGGVHSSGSTVFVYYRGVKASSNYIEFGDCWRGSNGGETKTNTANIPVLIVGIKKMPDITYIGTELFEGNGIKISNGEISTSETIYDMSSNNSSINLGYTNGIVHNATVSMDLSKYKRIVAYTKGWGSIDLDLTNSNYLSATNVSFTIFASVLHTYLQQISVNTSKTTLTYTSKAYGANGYVGDYDMYIRKIEGFY